ncbi:MAG: type II CAAX endopeptidase family protein [bacterium]|nr:type II CAAX endopeptidase family protein [bacterium]
MKVDKDLLGRIGKLILVFLLFEFSPYLQWIPIFVFKIKNITPQVDILLGAFSNLILLFVLFIIYRKSLREEWQHFRKNFNKSMDSCFKYWLLGLAGMMISNILINSFLKLGQAENEQLVQSMITAFPGVMLINAGIIAPIIEELIFRKAFKDAIKKKWPFILASGLVFGFMHVIAATSLIEVIFFIPYSCLGIAFAYMYYDTDSVFTPILAHIFHNTILILVSILL